jgi:rare lipoprotein A
MGQAFQACLQAYAADDADARRLFGRALRLCAVVLGCAVLANCSAAEKFSRTEKTQQRIAEDAEIAKGGGHYKLGKPYAVNGRTYTPSEEPNYRVEGIASWYGPDFHGRLTANGELYNMNGYSAAHPTLPLPSYARVTNLNNGKSIIVRVNNRGPFVHNRLVDVSVGTARALDFYGRGVTRVRLEYVGRAPIEGSDDKMLLATLREGSPAPAPSQVMLASSKPFLPRESKTTPLPVERPFALGTGTAPGTARSAPQLASAESKPVAKPAAKPSSKSSGEALRTEAAVRSAPAAERAPVRSFAPERTEPVGMMSGRGLY